MLPVIRKGEWVNHINDQCDCCFELVPEGFYWIELPPVDDKGDNEDRDTDTSK